MNKLPIFYRCHASISPKMTKPAFHTLCIDKCKVSSFANLHRPYFFLLTEALAAAARELGLPADTADRLASITCFGAGAMVATSPGEAAELRRRVTSPGGTTQAAMVVMKDGRFRELVFRAAQAARDRSRELALK